MMRCIEYQHRGLPHAHIVFQLENMPVEHEDIVKWIDANICATMPQQPMDETSATYEEDLAYYNMVKKKNVHHHSTGEVNSCMENGQCKKGFSDTFFADESSINELGFPSYKRLTVADLMIVPHNRKLLMDWDGHVCLEFAARRFVFCICTNICTRGRRRLQFGLMLIGPMWRCP
jgi:hypothetical protein